MHLFFLFRLPLLAEFQIPEIGLVDLALPLELVFPFLVELLDPGGDFFEAHACHGVEGFYLFGAGQDLHANRIGDLFILVLGALLHNY